MDNSKVSVSVFYRGKTDNKIYKADHGLATQADILSHPREWQAFRNSEDERRNGLPKGPDLFQAVSGPQGWIAGEVEDQELDVKIRRRPTL
jgi:hypothetical protein